MAVVDESLVERATLRKGQLNLLQLVMSTLANVAPAQGIFFSIAFLAATMGGGAPLGMLVASIAIFTVGNTLAEFSKELPSAGSFITFISRTFGAHTGIVLAITVSLGYIVAISGVLLEIGGWVSAVLLQNFGMQMPWQVITLASAVVITVLVLIGIKISSQWAVVLFITEGAVLTILSIAILIHGGAQGLHLSPFVPSNITGGLKSFGLAFPLLVFSFVGWENGGALAEETINPRRNIPRAVFLAIAIVSVLYVLTTYVAVEGFGASHLTALANNSAPFNTLAESYLGSMGVFLIDFIGFTSLFACVIAAANSQSRIIFHAGREGLIPKAFGRILPSTGTPWIALLSYLGIAVALIVIVGWNMQPLTYYADMGSLGTIPIIMVYVAANLALPIYILKHNRNSFRWIRHLVIPVIGLLVLCYSFWSLIEPGQPAPFNYFPYIVLGLVVLSVVYAIWLGRRNRAVLDAASQTLAE